MPKGWANRSYPMSYSIDTKLGDLLDNLNGTLFYLNETRRLNWPASCSLSLHASRRER